MRYIGNKTKLLPAIEAAIAARGGPPGTFFDIFAGTCAVACRFKELGWRVVANDRMQLSYVRQVARIETSRKPSGLGALFREMESAPDADGLVTRQYSPAGPAGRRFFTEVHARRIDGALEYLARRRAEGVEPAAIHLLLSSVLDAADRVANISGTYGAFLKEWQANTRQPLPLRPPAIVPGPRPLSHEAHREDCFALAPRIECDVLYVDPPYNRREYAANYHVLEAIAERPFLAEADLPAFEAAIYGKSGLRPYERSDFCDPARCAAAFRRLFAAARANVVLVSYNEEGIASRAEIEAALREGLETDDVCFEEVRHRRFRSDSDHAARRYRVLEGRGRDEIAEWLVSARRTKPIATGADSNAA